MPTKKRVVVLGANGFIGRHLIDALAQTDWAIPIAAVRQAAVTRASNSAVEVTTCDANDLPSHMTALAGADHVVNCVFGDSATLIASARNVFTAAAAHRLQRVVHLSSMAVYGSVSGLVDETTAPIGNLGRYGKTKLATELIAADFAREGSSVVILRPSCVYGPGDRQWTQRIGLLLLSGRLGNMGRYGEGTCNLIHVNDLVAAVIASLQRPNIEGQTFNISNRNPGTWNDYLHRFGAALGTGPLSQISAARLRLESLVLAPPLKLLELASSKAGMRTSPPLIPPSLAHLFRQKMTLDTRKADALLDFSRTPLDQGIASAARWLASNETRSRRRALNLLR